MRASHKRSTSSVLRVGNGTDSKPSRAARRFAMATIYLTHQSKIPRRASYRSAGVVAFYSFGIVVPIYLNTGNRNG